MIFSAFQTGKKSDIRRTFCRLPPAGGFVRVHCTLDAQGNPDGSPAHTPSLRFMNGRVEFF